MSITHSNFLTQVRNYTEVDSNVLTDAIIQDFNDPGEKWYNLNFKYSNEWPNISQARPEDVPADAHEYKDVENKYDKYFSDKPGRGD